MKVSGPAILATTVQPQIWMGECLSLHSSESALAKRRSCNTSWSVLWRRGHLTAHQVDEVVDLVEVCGRGGGGQGDVGADDLVLVAQVQGLRHLYQAL